MTRHTTKDTERYYKLRLSPTLFDGWVVEREYGNAQFKSPVGAKRDFFVSFDEAFLMFNTLFKQKEKRGYRMQDLNGQVFEVEAETFTKDYRYLEGYDDFVESIASGKVYKANYKGAKVQLVEVSNMGAIEKIERGLMAFREELIRQGFGKKTEEKE